MRGSLVLSGLLTVTVAWVAHSASAQIAEGSSARDRLAAAGIPFSDEAFLRYAAAGDAETLRLFLDAGIGIESKNAEGKTALQLASDNGRWEAVDLLVAAGASVRPVIEASRRPSRWENLYEAALELLTAISGLLIAVVGWLFTRVYNQRQQALASQREEESRRLSLLEATEKMLPHLGEDTKDAALVTLTSLASETELVVKLAELYPGRAGAVAALEILAKQEGDKRDLSVVSSALFSSLYLSAGEVGERGVIELLADRLSDEELRQILNEVDPQGRTALMEAAKRNRGGNIQKLVDLGAAIDVVDRGGETALHHAARYGNRNATKAILDLVEDWDEGKRLEFINMRVRRTEQTALDLARYATRKPPDPDRMEHYQAVVRRLEHAGGTWGG